MFNSSGGGFQDEPLVREQRREVVEMRLVLRLVRVFAVHGLDLEQREELLLFLGRPDLAGDQVAGLQIEPADLRRRNVNVLRAGQVIETLRTQEAEAFRQHFEHALGKQHAGALGIFLEDVENDLVLAHRAEILHAQFLGHLVQLAHLHRLQLGDVERRGDFVALRAAAFLRLRLLHLARARPAWTAAASRRNRRRLGDGGFRGGAAPLFNSGDSDGGSFRRRFRFGLFG